MKYEDMERRISAAEAAAAEVRAVVASNLQQAVYSRALDRGFAVEWGLRILRGRIATVRPDEWTAEQWFSLARRVDAAADVPRRREDPGDVMLPAWAR